MAVVWRVEFFNKDHGRNEMSGWMLEHLKPGEVSDGFSVSAGHCKAINTLRVQVKCAVRETEGNAGAACYKDTQGRPIAERTDQFREQPPQPETAAPQPAATSRSSTTGGGDSNLGFWFCLEQNYWPTPQGGGGEDSFTRVFQGPAEPGVEGEVCSENGCPFSKGAVGTSYAQQFEAWVLSRHTGASTTTVGCKIFKTRQRAEQVELQDEEFFRVNTSIPVAIVDWSPK